jgi:signal transduction histidine kinase
MRDMHDGTGGRLVSALSLLRSGGATQAALEETLVEAIDDLHLTIDSLRPGAMDLPSVLGLLRARLERQLRPHAVHLEWAIGDAGEDEELSPDQVLHVIRIVQEAVANALRHAAATTVRVATGRDGDATWLEIADDGRGGAKPRSGGRGLANLAQRASLLGGRLDLASSEGGTRVRVTLGASVS